MTRTDLLLDTEFDMDKHPLGDYQTLCEVDHSLILSPSPLELSVFLVTIIVSAHSLKWTPSYQAVLLGSSKLDC